MPPGIPPAPVRGSDWQRKSPLGLNPGGSGREELRCELHGEGLMCVRAEQETSAPSPRMRGSTPCLRVRGGSSLRMRTWWWGIPLFSFNKLTPGECPAIKPNQHISSKKAAPSSAQRAGHVPVPLSPWRTNLTQGARFAEREDAFYPQKLSLHPQVIYASPADAIVLN